MPDKPIIWLGSSRRDLRAFPALARRLAGFQLPRVQQGLDPDDWKPMQTLGPGVREIRIHIAGAHRVFYLATRAGRSTFFTGSKRKRRRRAHTIYGSAATGSVL
jgi:phage-related protein